MIFFFLYIDGLFHGIWEKLDDIKDPLLKEKTATLPILIESAYANSTLNKYKSAWEKWIKWCSQYLETLSSPADPFYIAIYFNDIVTSGGTKGALESAYLGIRWGHLNCGLATPTDNSFVKLALEGGKRIIARRNGRSGGQKLPLESPIIKEIFALYGNTTNLIDYRFVLMCILGFTGFFRISELLNLKVKDITFESQGMKIFVEKSKCDQLREGHIVHIAMLNSNLCPVACLKKYLSTSRLDEQSESFVICRLARTKSGHNAIGKYPISYSTARESFKKHLAKIINPTNYSTHSLRSGGATEAANNGTSDRLLSKHGRWKSDLSRNRYIKENAKARFEITKKLGI